MKFYFNTALPLRNQSASSSSMMSQTVGGPMTSLKGNVGGPMTSLKGNVGGAMT